MTLSTTCDAVGIYGRARGHKLMYIRFGPFPQSYRMTDIGECAVFRPTATHIQSIYWIDVVGFFTSFVVGTYLRWKLNDSSIFINVFGCRVYFQTERGILVIRVYVENHFDGRLTDRRYMLLIWIHRSAPFFSLLIFSAVDYEVADVARMHRVRFI